MKLLLDTQCWLWMTSAPERLNPAVQQRIRDAGTKRFLSAASCWEIAIKSGLGKLRLPLEPERYVPSRMTHTATAPLPIEAAHALRVSRLPLHHRDPFDRMLVAQAQIERMTLLTADRALAAYDVPILWA